MSIKEDIISLLPEYKQEDVEKFASYCDYLQTKKKDGVLENPWSLKHSAEHFVNLFKRVNAEGLVFDGTNITLQNTGISYNYVAYKNKMLLAYPESVIDLELIYEGDTYEFSKDNGKVIYWHKILNPFDHKDADIIGGYAVIKNRRGEFITPLSKEEIDKHKAVAKTKYIWNAWFPEMCKKTIIKKACSTHFRDIFQKIEEMDNTQYDLDKSNVQDNSMVSLYEELEKINDVSVLRDFYKKNAGKGKELEKAITERSVFLKNKSNENS